MDMLEIGLARELICVMRMNFRIAMIGLFALAAASISGAPGNAVASSFLLESSPSLGVEPESSRWENVGGQFLAGTAGGVVGTIGGGLVGVVGGGVVGVALFGTGSEDDDDGDEGGLVSISPQAVSMVIGGLIGAALGGSAGTAFMVERVSPSQYPSRGMLPAFFGSVLGAGGSIAVMGYMGQTGVSDFQWGFASGTLFVLGSSSLGAVLLDRAVASPASFSVAPWSPRPGMQGARVGLAF